MSSLVKILFLLSLIFVSTNLFAQDIEAQLKTDDDTSGFTVLDMS